MKTNNKLQQNLSDITRGMYHAASATTALVAQQYLNMVDQFFDREENGTITAKTIKINLDYQNAISIPLISLVGPKGIVLDEMKVSMALRLDQSEIKDATHPSDNSNATRTSFGVSFSPKNNYAKNACVIDVDMIFKAVDTPEGVMRIIDEYTNRIIPCPNNKPEDNSPPMPYC